MKKIKILILKQKYTIFQLPKKIVFLFYYFSMYKFVSVGNAIYNSKFSVNTKNTKININRFFRKYEDKTNFIYTNQTKILHSIALT